MKAALQQNILAAALTRLPETFPPSVEARVGKIEFAKGLPTKAGIQQILDVQDFQRACQLYQQAESLMPVYGIFSFFDISPRSISASLYPGYFSMIAFNVLIASSLSPF
jgi:hypothetical protein